jgi:pyridoxal phosphate enzyme (YggS family)
MTNTTIAAPGSTSPQRLDAIRAKIAAAAAGVGRDPAAVKLIAVSKTFDVEAIRPLLHHGHRCFGENRVQEAQGKWPQLRSQFCDIELHLIGPLQSNKARDAVALFDVIHTLDRPKIASAIAAAITELGRHPSLFIQVNTGCEPQKAGILPAEAAEFATHCRNELKLPIAGLMCIPPVDEEPAIHFAFLAKLGSELGLQHLSMGMSGDFETAIELGATNVRIGSAIFGGRG